MKNLLKLASFTGLGLTIVPAFLVWSGTLSWQHHSSLMIAGTLIWFAAAPFWMREDHE